MRFASIHNGEMHDSRGDDVTPQPAYQPRIDMVDSLRGFALMGLFLNHSIEYFELYWAHPTKSVIHDVLWALFEGKSFSLLALCFGLSFFIIMDRQSARGVDFSGRFVWRLAILFIFGWLHGLVYMGEVLQILAPMGLILVPLNRIRANWILVVLGLLCLAELPLLWQSHEAAAGVAWANLPPHFLSANPLGVYIHGSFGDVIARNVFFGQLGKWWYYIESGRMMQIAGLYLIGLVLGRIGFFATPEKFRVQRYVAMALAVVAWLALYLARGPLTGLIPQADGQHMARSTFNMVVDDQMCMAQMVFVVLALIELYQRGGRRLLNLLAPVGRMTLTLYIMQSLVFVPVYYGFGLGMHAVMTQTEALCLGIAFFAAQMVFAHVWFRYFYYGPLEWLWRAATYLSVNVPFRRRTA